MVSFDNKGVELALSLSFVLGVVLLVSFVLPGHLEETSRLFSSSDFLRYESRRGKEVSTLGLEFIVARWSLRRLDLAGVGCGATSFGSSICLSDEGESVGDSAAGLSVFRVALLLLASGEGITSPTTPGCKLELCCIVDVVVVVVIVQKRPEMT